MLESILLKTIVKIDKADDDSELLFYFDDGTGVCFYHEQSCCEDVHINDVVGDWSDLLGEPLRLAEERTLEGFVEDYETYTWTFYSFATTKGHVDVRWYGSSNGYYSERVDTKEFTWKEA